MGAQGGPCYMTGVTPRLAENISWGGIVDSHLIPAPVKLIKLVQLVQLVPQHPTLKILNTWASQSTPTTCTSNSTPIPQHYTLAISQAYAAQ